MPVILMFLCVHLQLPTYSPNNDAVTMHGLLYINPLARLPEFLLGILTAKLWLNQRDLLTLGKLAGTIVEILALVFFNMLYFKEIIEMISLIIPKVIAPAFSFWASFGFVSSLAFMFLILTFAQANGIISRFLSTKACVLLGEISFSIYLLHQIQNRFFDYFYNMHYFDGIPLKLIFALYWLVLIAFSYAVWSLVECPCRKMIISQFSRQRAKEESPCN